jgi:hypothetical protein
MTTTPTVVRYADLVESVAGALQYISYSTRDLNPN